MVHLPRHTKVPTGQSGHIALSTPCGLNRHDWGVFHEPKPASVLNQMQHRQISFPLFASLLIDRFDIKWGKPCLETASPFFPGKFGQKWEMIPQDFSKIIKCICSGHSLTIFCVLQLSNYYISYVIPNRNWKLLCMCVHKYIYTYIHKYRHKHASLLPPPDFLIILFCIKTCSLSTNIGFPSEFRISRSSD